MTIPVYFGNFDNNIESIGLGIWYDGDYSDIWSWLVNNRADCFGEFMWPEPNGYVLAAEVTFKRKVESREAQYICFNT